MELELGSYILGLLTFPVVALLGVGITRTVEQRTNERQAWESMTAAPRPRPPPRAARVGCAVGPRTSPPQRDRLLSGPPAASGKDGGRRAPPAGRAGSGTGRPAQAGPGAAGSPAAAPRRGGDAETKIT